MSLQADALQEAIRRVVTSARPTGVVQEQGNSLVVPMVVDWDAWRALCEIARKG